MKRFIKTIQKISGNGIEVMVTNAKYDSAFAKKLKSYSFGKINFTEATPSLQNLFVKKLERDHEVRNLIASPFSEPETQTTFEKYFCHCLHNSFPWSLAEGFQESFQFYAKYWKSFSSLNYLVTENQYQHDSLALAVFSSVQGKLIALPHFFPWEILAGSKIDYLQRGNFLKIERGCKKWGGENSVGSGSLYSYSIPSKSQQKPFPILYVASEFTPYLLDYQISVDGDGYEVFAKFKIFVDELFQALPTSLIQSMWLKERAKPRYDGVTLKYPDYIHRLDPEISAPIYMAQSKIIIVEGFSTALFEALVSNVPVLTFWPDGLYQFDKNYSDFFKELEFAEIIHYRPDQLSQKLFEVEENPNIWWQSERVQLARISFLEKNFHLLPEMKNTLLNLLKE